MNKNRLSQETKEYDAGQFADYLISMFYDREVTYQSNPEVLNVVVTKITSKIKQLDEENSYVKFKLRKSEKYKNWLKHRQELLRILKVLKTLIKNFDKDVTTNVKSAQTAFNNLQKLITY